MKKYLTLISILTLISCSQSESDNSLEKSPSELQSENDSIENIKAESNGEITIFRNSFKEFRDALYQGNKLEVKRFIDFPIYNENNEIWYLAEAGDVDFLSLHGDAIKPFPEKEFDRNYKFIFPKTFINSILKIKTEILFAKGEFETPELEFEGSIYKTYASFNKEEKTLILNFASETLLSTGEEEYEKSEFNVIYYFDFVDNALQFKKVGLAG